MSFCRKKTTSTLCLRLLNVLNVARLRRLFEFLLLAQAIKTNVGCASTSSKCTYVLNANSKGPGETAHLRKCAESFELLLLAHAIKTNVDVYGMNVSCRALARLLVQLWFYLFVLASLMPEHYAREYGCWHMQY